VSISPLTTLFDVHGRSGKITFHIMTIKQKKKYIMCLLKDESGLCPLWSMPSPSTS
jgi:hypothetical protein